MTYVLEHVLVSHEGITSVRTQDGLTGAFLLHGGPLAVHFPGRLIKSMRAEYNVKVLNPPGTEHGHLPLKMEIRTPDGQPFTADHITLDDIRRFRDLRGVSQGTWTYTVSGQGPARSLNEGEKMTGGEVVVRIKVIETVTSKSAPLLVNRRVGANQGQTFVFDLWQVGSFTATLQPLAPVLGPPRVMTLQDPDGNVQVSDTGRLSFPVTLRTLDRSRDSAGNVRPWRLDVSPPTSPESEGEVLVRATVVGSARIGTAPLHARIDDLIGVRGGNLKLFAEVVGGQLAARLEILDKVSAALLDRYGYLDRVLKRVPQEAGVDVDSPDFSVAPGTTYNLYKHSQSFDGAKVFVFGLRVGAIDIRIGQSVHIQPPVPALKVSIEVEGSAKIEYEGIGLGNISIRNNKIELEVGLRLRPDGTFSLVSWIQEDQVDVDIANDALLLAIAAGLVIPGANIVTVALAVEFFEGELNRVIREGLQGVVDDAGSQVPQILAMVLGDDFTYRALRFEGEDIVLEFDAPREPDPKPSKIYNGVIGRSADQVGPREWLIRPFFVGNTWAADNLKSKIQNIVVVMMENRSFDHVLGYMAAEGDQNSDGLTTDITKLLTASALPDVPDFKLQLRESNIKLNGVNRRTKFPASVGHSVADVAQQLSEQIATDTGRIINSPTGFRENFRRRVTTAGGVADQITVHHVLGYYDAFDLPFFKFLTDNYAWCEQFYCSHPGPTLPNRMFWLTGDVQYDRTGEAILDNNKGSNLALSCAPTIFDLLERKGVGWRVYESFPSVAMLRMFARYATDITNIRDIKHLEQDIAEGDLPSVTFIEPAMHHDPQNDDHPPDADMYHGQLFLERVYKALRAKEALWAGTLLIIAYDEHGGFYDHLMPPIADLRIRPGEAHEDGPTGPGHFTPDNVVTRYGGRVPTFVVSPWVPAGKGPDIVLDHCSILKTILAWQFDQNAPFLSDRVHASRSFEAYLTETTPRLDVPTPTPLPRLDEPIPQGRAIVTEPLFRSQMEAGNVDFHDLTGMLARMLGRDSANPLA